MITKQELRDLRYCYKLALEWRGSMVGNPDPEPLLKFDRRMENAKIALKYLDIELKCHLANKKLLRS